MIAYNLKHERVSKEEIHEEVNRSGSWEGHSEELHISTNYKYIIKDNLDGSYLSVVSLGPYQVTATMTTFDNAYMALEVLTYSLIKMGYLMKVKE